MAEFVTGFGFAGLARFVVPTGGRNLLRAGRMGAACEQQVPHGFAVRNDKVGKDCGCALRLTPDACYRTMGTTRIMPGRSVAMLRLSRLMAATVVR